MNKRLNVDEIISKIESKKEEVKKRGVKRIGLFGSYLKNEQNKGSDIDIIVEFDSISYDNYFEVLSLLRQLLKQKVDLGISESLRPEFSYIKKEAKYAKL